jgi:hypothetical protein
VELDAAPNTNTGAVVAPAPAAAAGVGAAPKDVVVLLSGAAASVASRGAVAAAGDKPP